jgi:NAD(P)-dependent dehydrogenase (short-subunit alcohol dehydrogenase family)
MNRFKGKVIIVTGDGTGIGAGTARRFLREGAFVVLNGRREHRLHETIAGSDAARSPVHPGDVSDEEYVKRLVEDTVTKFGKLDVLVNNAGFAIFGPFAQTTTQDWRKLMATDLDSVYFACREARRRAGWPVRIAVDRLSWKRASKALPLLKSPKPPSRSSFDCIHATMLPERIVENQAWRAKRARRFDLRDCFKIQKMLRL